MWTAAGCFRFERTRTAPSAVGRCGRLHRRRLEVYYPHFYFAYDTPPSCAALCARTRPPTDAVSPIGAYKVVGGAVSSHDGWPPRRRQRRRQTLVRWSARSMAATRRGARGRDVAHSRRLWRGLAAAQNISGGG